MNDAHEFESRRMPGILWLLLLGLLGVGAYFGWGWYQKQNENFVGSDGKDLITVKIGLDDYAGYAIWRSPLMQRALARRGIKLVFTDELDQAKRAQGLKDGSFDMIFMPVAEMEKNLLDRAGTSPGVIGPPICASIGADCVLGFSDRFPKGVPKELLDPTLQIVYAKGSPSEFMIDHLVYTGDNQAMRSSDAWRRDVADMDTVVKMARARQGDAWVVWEPWATILLAEFPELKMIHSSATLSNVITDVPVINRKFYLAKRELVRQIFETYYSTMMAYQNNEESFLEDMRITTGLKPDQVKAMRTKINWFDLQEAAADQLGISRTPGVRTKDGLYRCVLECERVLKLAGDIPQGLAINYDSLFVEKAFVLELLENAPITGGNGTNQVDFAPLSDEQWAKLTEAFPLELQEIKFESGVNVLSDEGKALIDEIARKLQGFSSYRIEVRGHTAPGDEEQNLILSKERAEVVMQRLIAVHNFDSDQLHATGLGSSRPLPLKSGEFANSRTYRARLPRVEFVLLQNSL